MNNKLITVVLTLVVGIILAGSVLMPVLNGATKTEQTFVNNGVFNYGVFDNDDTYTLEYDAATNTLEVNDTPITGILSGTSAESYSIISADDFLLRYGYNNNGYYSQVIGLTSGGTTTRLYMASLTATISGGVLSVTGVDTNGDDRSTSFNFTEMYAIVPSVDQAVLKYSSESVYIKGDSEIYASGLTTVTQWSDMFHFEGTYNDGITITSPNTTATFSNIEWNIEPVAGYTDLYKLTSIEFDITISDTTVHATYSYFAVPTTVTAELSQHLTPGQIALMGAIPVLVIVALLMVAVGAIARRND